MLLITSPSLSLLALAFSMSYYSPRLWLSLPFHLCCHPVVTCSLPCSWTAVTSHLISALKTSPPPAAWQPMLSLSYSKAIEVDEPIAKTLSLNKQSCLGTNPTFYLSFAPFLSTNITLHLPYYIQERILVVLQRWFAFLFPIIPCAYAAFPLHQLIIISEIQMLLQGSGKVNISMKPSLILPLCVIVLFSNLL